MAYHLPRLDTCRRHDPRQEPGLYPGVAVRRVAAATVPQRRLHGRDPVSPSTQTRSRRHWLPSDPENLGSLRSTVATNAAVSPAFSMPSRESRPRSVWQRQDITSQIVKLGNGLASSHNRRSIAGRRGLGRATEPTSHRGSTRQVIVVWMHPWGIRQPEREVPARHGCNRGLWDPRDSRALTTR